MDPALVQVFGIFGFVAAFFFYLGYKLISRKKTRLSYTCASFYLISAFGLILNIIQRIIDKHDGKIEQDANRRAGSENGFHGLPQHSSFGSVKQTMS